LLDQGCEALGFVSPGHFAFQLPEILQALHKTGYHPVTVYNSNGYDKVGTLRSLEGLIDVYLPDMKYFNIDTARRYSDAPDYPQVAQKALREMYRQKGKSLIVSDSGQALAGMIIRHLVLPGHVDESKLILQWIAGELSPDIHISLMAQYYPTIYVKKHPFLHRKITREEYQAVTDEMDRLGFGNGWIQEQDSPAHYNPDFNRAHPFEN
jgi:putative pyruvate formate lyase activating enzyme